MASTGALSCGEITCEALIEDLTAIHYTKLVSVSAFTILLYDYLLTLMDEWDLIWHKGSGIGWGTGLFTAIRYLTIAEVSFVFIVMFKDNIPTEVCEVWVKIQWFAGCGIVMLAEIALQIRIVAMYGNTRWMVVFMVCTFLLTFGTTVALIVCLISGESAEFFHPLPGDLFICVPLNLPSFFKEVWIPLFAHEALLFVLALIKGIQNVRVYGKEGLRTRFTIFLVSDSIQYYFVVLVAFLIMELVWVIKGVLYIELPIGHAFVIGSIMCQHLLLNVRRRYYSRGIGERSETQKRTTALLDFADDDLSLSTFHVETIPHDHPV